PNNSASDCLQASGRLTDDSYIRNQLASAYPASGHTDEVLRTIPAPKTSDDYYLRASAFYLSKRFPEADQESAAALELAPNNPEVLVLRTRLLQRAGEQNEALSSAQKAISLSPNWDQPYYLAGVSY